MAMKKQVEGRQFKYPGIPETMDGNTAVVMCEREASDAAGAYPITPSTQMGEYWAAESAKGHINISDRALIFVEPEGEHAAAAVTAGLSMTGLRACNFSSGQGIAYMHESLYAAVGKRLTYILNMGCRAMTKASLNVHAGHDDYHAVDDAGFFQVFGKNVQEVCDLNIISHKIAELALNPGIVAQDGFLTTHLIESLLLPERELIEEYLGRPDDMIETPTPAQCMIYGETRRRIAELWTVDNPVMSGTVQNQDAYMQSVAAQRPFFFDHIALLTDRAMEEFYELTGRRYRRVSTYRCEDAEYILLGQGSVVYNAEAVVDYLRAKRGPKVGVVNMTMFRPFPGDVLGEILKGRKGVAVLERTDQPLAEDQPLMREVRATIAKCLENSASRNGNLPYPDHAVYDKKGDQPALYSGCFGMGSRDLQPEGIIAAIENMLPDGKHRKTYYLSIDFIHEKAYTPKQEIYQQQLLEGYPDIKDLALHGSENPNLMPDGSITVRLHSVGGWGAIATGKSLALTLVDLLGYHVKANPKYGSEKKGQPTTYYLSAAPEAIRINSEYFYVDVVLSPDPNVFRHSNPLAGLKKGGIFIIQSDYEKTEELWQSIPQRFQKIIIDQQIRVFCVDGFKIAREEASDPELQFRMQGIAFQGAFFAATSVMEKAKLTEEGLFNAIEGQLKHKFGAKGARVVEDNLRVVRRGFVEAREVLERAVSAEAAPLKQVVNLPITLAQEPQNKMAANDIHRSWEQTGNFYSTGKGGDNLTDPFMALSFIPAASGIFRDMTGIRFGHPEWDPQACTGCGHCWTVCPDSSIPGLVNTLADIFESAIKRIETSGRTVKHLRKAVKTVESKVRPLLDAAGESANVSALIQASIQETYGELGGFAENQPELEQEFDWLTGEIGTFTWAITKPFYTLKEKEAKGSGGLLSITVDPYTCKGCMECVAVCGDNALKNVTQTPETIARLRKNWEFWLALPNTLPEYIRIDDLEAGIGALETLLLNKEAYKSMVGGDGACLGCGEKTLLHLFTATVQALMQPRVRKHVEYLGDLIQKLEKHIHLKIAETMDLNDSEGISRALLEAKEGKLTLTQLTQKVSAHNNGSIDPQWLKRVTQLLSKLKHLKWQYTDGGSGKGRAPLGIVNSTGCSSVWASTFPYNPYPFPWTNHLFQDSTSMAMGLFEGHMAKMADGFKAIRQTELELKGAFDPNEQEAFFRYFNWKDFTDDEWHLCPPVVAVGGDGALYDIGFQNLSRMMMSGKPIKVVALDTQVYSNTGGQACTSGFFGQVSDMAEYGAAHKGKEEIRKEIGLIGMAHRTTFILQGSTANTSHLIEAFIRGLLTRRPALFNVYAPCMPEHGIADDVAEHQSKLALESRAYPIFTYDPDKGMTPVECFNLDGNPALEADWPSYALKYIDDAGSEATMELPLTFADFAVTEARFKKHFKKAPKDTWNDSMLPVAEFIELPEAEREGKFPYVWVVDKKGRLSRVIVAKEVAMSCEERRGFWRMLKSIAGVDREVIDKDQITREARVEVVQKLASGLLNMLEQGDGGALLTPTGLIPLPASGEHTGAVSDLKPGAAPPSASVAPAAPAKAAAPTTSSSPSAGNGYVPARLDSSECNACGDCININPKVFQFNEKKQAYIVNPKGGPYRDIVRAAEKCTSHCIHPGTPADRSEKDLEKWVKRAAKYNA
ncbi:MAG: 2-oxoacid:acceptor oxidoreductase family protein [Candidatus Hydrogenedentes bacterium]|nr:2-oxoacid:acceptor oxidoreductase family protein [Candidatus Hydrogenedentota bacterium]